MKINYKFLIFFIKLTALAAMFNHYLKLIIKSERDSEKNNELSYDYRFGKINYIKKGKGPAMLLLHSPMMGGSKAEWPLLTCSLSKNYTVYAPDLPGFGNSAQPELSYSSYLYVSFVNDFIQNVIKEPAIVIASGKSADFTVCAAAFKESNFKKVIMVSPTGFKKTQPKCPFRNIMKWLMGLPLYGTFLYNLFWMDFFVANKTIGRYFRIDGLTTSMQNHPLRLSDQTSKSVICSLFSGDLNIDIKKAITKLNIPILITLGSDDNINGIPAEIETLMFCKAEGSPHSPSTSSEFLVKITAWLKK